MQGKPLLVGLRHEAPGKNSSEAIVFYDSKYAADAVRGLTTIKENDTLISFATRILKEVTETRTVSWELVCSHSKKGYIHGNFWADLLAEKGSKKEISLQ